MDPTTPTIEVPAGEAAAHHPDVNILSPDVSMMILTWVTFFSLLVILHKFGFKPILTAVQKREDEIRRSLEEADKIRQQLVAINANRDQVISDAHHKAQEIMEQSRKAALELVRVIQDKARGENQILLANAKREIEAETLKARYALRRESAELAVTLASKILKERLDEDGSDRIVNELIKDIK